MSFSDIFKSKFLDNFASVSLMDMGIAMVLAFGLGLFIHLVYKKTYNGVMYSSGFSLTLVALTMITTLVILAVTSNVVLSLGMVGALSIVRFRAAIKEPTDIAFCSGRSQWALCSPRNDSLAVGGSVLIGLMILVFANRKSVDKPFIVVLSCADYDSEVRAKEFLDDQTTRAVIKSKSARKGAIELHYEVRLKDDNTDFINLLSAMNGVNSAVLVSYQGDYLG